MIGKDHAGRQRDEQRRDGVILAVTVHGHDGGGRFAADEAGKQREVAVAAQGERLERGAVLFGDVGGHGSIL